MSDEKPEFIIVKRRSSHEHEHHGGAWKIAFADFMTAMMAFFLVLWIINATDKNTKTIIARYFNPVKIEEPARASKGIRAKNGDPANTQEGASEKSPAPTPEATKEGKTPAQKETPQKDEHAAKKDPHASKSDGGASKPDAADKHDAKGKKESGAAPEARPGAQPNAAAEQALFSDPIATLDRLSDSTPLKMAGAARKPLALGNDGATFQDPFHPPALPDDDTPEDKPSEMKAPHTPETGAKNAEPSNPSAQRSETPVDEKNASKDQAEALRRDINARIASLKLANLPSVEVKNSTEGILISLTDNLQFSMFAVGSAEPRREAIAAVDTIAAALKKTPGKLIIRGHTDGRQYRSTVYDNWRLSSARAQMTYYMLTRAGISESRFDRIEGYADKNLRAPATPLDPKNRRIEILLSASQ